MPDLEGHSHAWHRMYDFRKRAPKVNWQSDADCSLRMRGYTELVFGNLPPKLRKKIDSALKRGYMLEDSTQLKPVIRLIEKHNPVSKDFVIGYVGKTDMEIFVPTPEQAAELCDTLKAGVVMTDKIKMQALHVGTPRRNMHPVVCRVAHAEDASGHAAHLKPCFTELRPLMNNALESWASDREAVARWCADDACTIRIPFDSHKDRKDV